MEKFDLNNIFQGISTLLQSDPSIMYARIGLILLGILLVYLGRRGILEPLVMIPMGLGMAMLQYPGAMEKYGAMEEEAQRQLIEGAKGIPTKEEMQHYVVRFVTSGV